MELTQVTQPTIAPQPVSTETVPASAVSSDFETFLLMLTTQLKNQDPLKPIDSSDYAVQLATFSGVEQQVKTNDLLEGLTQQMGLVGMAQLAGWVGMEARAAVPAFFDGAPVSLSPNPAVSAQEAVLVVRDANNDVVERVPIAVSSEQITWAGVDERGNPRASGLYSFELESYARDELIGTSPVDVYSGVTEARNEGGQTVLILSGGVKVSSSEVSALRAG